MTVTDKDMGFQALLAALDLGEKSKSVRMTIGFNGAKQATIAAYNEFGTTHIKERPFMRTTMDRHQARYMQLLQKAAGDVVDGAPPAVFLAVAHEVRNDLIESIIDWEDPPNKKATVDAKGFNNPLVHTGGMQRAIQIRLNGRFVKGGGNK